MIRRVTAVLNDDYSKKFDDIINMKFRSSNWKIKPKHREIVQEALVLLHDKEKLKKITTLVDESIKLHNHFPSIKKGIPVNLKSLNLLIKHKDNPLTDLDSCTYSSIFDEAIQYFYKNVHEYVEPDNDQIVKRQMVYISNESNAKFNEIAIKYHYKLKDLSNVIIKTFCDR